MCFLDRSWCKEYGKKYSSEKEKAYRFSVFKYNYAKARLLDDGSDTSSCMHLFSDRRPEEYRNGLCDPHGRGLYIP
ncbi:hypothetical protein V6N13_021236 [Hibiscus sabdariffa]